ncbi:MAG: hypothetical protein MK101_08070 [Phycisphaerales bacterium]|nr:hypothetical protein [Phycisphaerales bacterium]
MPPSLDSRIESLERSRSRLRLTCLGLGMAIVAMVLVGADSLRGTEPLITRGLTIIGPDHTARVELAADESGAWVHLRNPSGKLMATLGAPNSGGQLLLMDKDDRMVATLGPSVTGEGYLALGGTSGTQVRLGTWSPDGGKLWFRTPLTPQPVPPQIEPTTP